MRTLVPLVLILVTASCDFVLGPDQEEIPRPPVATAPEAPVTPEPEPEPDDPPSGTILPSAIAFSECLEWTLDDAFLEICGKSGIVVRRPDSSEKVVHASTAYYPGDPAWSPDGGKIAFAAYPSCESITDSCMREIFVMNADGSAVTQLTTSTGPGSSEPAWSPDGRRIAYTVLGRDSTGIFPAALRVMEADGSGGAPLGDLAGSGPAWSPDGTRLAFTVHHDERSAWIYVADADGSNPRAVTHEPDARDYLPSWSPDGRSIAFGRSWQYPDGHSSCQVFVIEADGANPTQLTHDGFCAYGPAWSPDGTTISFNGSQPSLSFHGIMLMNVDGSSQEPLRSSFSWPSRVAWAPLP